MKTRKGFVSNSSSSSFVLFGTDIEDLTINKLYVNKFKDLMLEKHGDLDKVPEGKTSWDDESRFHQLMESIKEDELDDYLEGICSWEKSELLDLSRRGDYSYLGFSPGWFQDNPTKTYIDAVKEHTEEYLKMGLTPDEIRFDFINEVDYES